MKAATSHFWRPSLVVSMTAGGLSSCKDPLTHTRMGQPNYAHWLTNQTSANSFFSHPWVP